METLQKPLLVLDIDETLLHSTWEQLNQQADFCYKVGKTVQNVPLISAKMCHEPRPDFEKIATVMPLSVSVRTVPIISVRIVPFWRAA